MTVAGVAGGWHQFNVQKAKSPICSDSIFVDVENQKFLDEVFVFLGRSWGTLRFSFLRDILESLAHDIGYSSAASGNLNVA